MDESISSNDSVQARGLTRRGLTRRELLQAALSIAAVGVPLTTFQSGRMKSSAPLIFMRCRNQRFNAAFTLTKWTAWGIS